MNWFYFFVIISLSTSCIYHPDEANATKNPAKLIGTWYLNEDDLYNKIHFQDSTHVAFDTHIDTMYFYTYQLRNDTLFLYQSHGRLLNTNIVLKLTDDSLIFGNLLDKEGIQKYSRKEKNKTDK